MITKARKHETDQAAAVRERPIPFSEAMVRAILDGAKTQTRRVIDPQPVLPFYRKLKAMDGSIGGMWTEHGGELDGQRAETRYPIRYGKPGDRLWVREAFNSYSRCCEPSKIADASYVLFRDGGQMTRTRVYTRPLNRYADGAFDGIKWRPSIHLPRWASRITLEVTRVRVERVQDISEGDAAAEGVSAGWYQGTNRAGEPCESRQRSAADAYRVLWDEINAARGFGWDVNPWVWVIEFKRVECESEKVRKW